MKYKEKISKESLAKIIPESVAIVLVCTTLFANIWPDIFFDSINFLLLTIDILINLITSTGLLQVITLILIGTIIPIFILTVTLLGKAAKTAKDQQAYDDEKNSRIYHAQIEELKEKIISNPEDTAELKRHIKKLETLQQFSKTMTARTAKKFNALQLKDAVIFPFSLFTISLFFQKLLHLISEHLTALRFVIFLISLVPLYYGLKKLLATLIAAQEIALNTDDSEDTKKMGKILSDVLADTFKEIATKEVPKPYVYFDGQNNGDPLVFKVNEEGQIKFTAELKKDGCINAKNVEVMLILSEEIKIIEDSSYRSYPQDADYSIPNGNTAVCQFDNMNTARTYPGRIKIMPKSTGEYRLWYKIESDKYVEEVMKEITILVTE